MRLSMRLQDVEKLNDSVDSSESDTDEIVWHSRQEADIYLDALWGPLFFRYERIRKDKDSAPRISDYRLVGLFLLLNVALQLAIAWKIDAVSESSYGSIGNALFGGACWRMSSANQFYYSLVYPSEFENSNDFDCLQPILALSMFPEKLDLDGNGFWTTDEAKSTREKLQASGSHMAEAIPEVLFRMAKYDFENRIGSHSISEHHDNVNLDMKFFEHYRGQIQMCLPIDPNLCGNLEVRGNLKHIFPEVKHGQERVVACRRNFDDFCVKLFGGDYQWIHYVTGEVCGSSTFARDKGVNTVEYEAVTTYRGESDSILGTTFVSFLVLLLFIWGMLIIVEFRSTYNFLYVVWHTPSAPNSDPDFAVWEDSKMVVKKLPTSHKIFAIFCIAIPRAVIAVVVLIVGRSVLLWAKAHELIPGGTDSCRGRCMASLDGDAEAERNAATAKKKGGSSFLEMGTYLETIVAPRNQWPPLNPQNSLSEILQPCLLGASKTASELGIKTSCQDIARDIL
eukprot:Skav216024  [mRNA]  locus=scaffold417:115092:123593:+ [translate_table: standard]